LGTGSNPEKNKICEIFLSINMLFERGYWQFDRKKVYIAQRKLFMPAKAPRRKNIVDNGSSSALIMVSSYHHL
jgi:hypothetical protein